MMNNQQRYFATFGKNVSEVEIGIPLETYTDEKRVALSPSAAERLIKLGFKINVETGAGNASDFHDSEYEKVGAKIVSAELALKSDLILKVRPPSVAEAQ